MKEQKKKKRKKRNPVSMVLMILGVGMLLFAAIYGGYQKWLTMQSEEKIENLKALVVEQPPVENPTEEEGPYVSPYSAVFSQNKDMVAWLNIPDTVIDYPVVQTKEDEQYYLRRDFFGEDDTNGTLFVAAHCNVTPPTDNIIIYGHNMRSGMMFGELDLYKDQEYEKEHSLIKLFTQDEERHYEILSAMYAKIMPIDYEGFVYYTFGRAKDEEDFNTFYENVKKASLYDTGVTAKYGDHLLTLSTCSGIGKSGRFVIVAKQIED